MALDGEIRWSECKINDWLNENKTKETTVTSTVMSRSYAICNLFQTSFYSFTYSPFCCLFKVMSKLPSLFTNHSLSCSLQILKKRNTHIRTCETYKNHTPLIANANWVISCSKLRSTLSMNIHFDKYLFLPWWYPQLNLILTSLFQVPNITYLLDK